MNFGQVLLSMLFIFFAICYFMMLFSIVVDLFRNHDMGGVAKAIWIIALIFVPLITMLAYVIVNSKGMASRNKASADQMQKAQEDYIKSLAGSTSATDQIAKGAELLSSGAITQAEFDALKSKALAG
ncbi:MAG: SHOCT domain-containing protein [Actinomycetes bacterium]